MRFFSVLVLSLAALVVAPPAGLPQQLEAPLGSVTVTFQLNDAYVRDRVLPGVLVEVSQEGEDAPVFSGTTDDSGQVVATMVSGPYLVSYSVRGYVPLERSATEIHTSGQIVTTSMARMLEAGVNGDTHGAGFVERIQIVLNWGSSPSQVRDADSHLQCHCTAPDSHVNWAAMQHTGTDHTVNLDVDDVDWGGPETITISTPPPGRYGYWVHNYSGPPETLGASEAVVRVFFDNEMVGEYHVPIEATARYWRPFAGIQVELGGAPRMVPFTPAQLAGGAHLRQAK